MPYPPTRMETPERPPKPAPVLVSACLLGRRCAYDGENRTSDGLVRDLVSQGEHPIPFCPEEAGGLGTPRPPAWIESQDAEAVLDGQARMVRSDGRDVTAGFLRGARGALEVCQREGIRRAILKQGSPSCGTRETHVGNVRVAGPGVTTALLRRHGVECEGA